MARRRTHALAGAGVGTSWTLRREISRARSGGGSVRAGFVVAGGAAGLLGGLAPDVLEPATNPNHRGLCHGLLFVALLCWGVAALRERARLGELMIVSLEAFAAGYVSHVVLDATTARGIPLLGVGEQSWLADRELAG